jgi:hypothetical protein
MLVVIALVAAGCSTERSTRDAMREEMERARSAEVAGDIAGAAHAYALAAEHHPGGELFLVAVRKAAVLSTHPQNPARSDSVALAWFRMLAAQPIPGPEKELVYLQIATLERSQAQAVQIRRQQDAGDSLTAVTRRLSLLVANQARQLQELETEVKRVSAELQQLKEIDVRLSRRKR